MENLIVEEEYKKTRIDKFLSEKIDISRSKIQKLIDENKILVNGKNINSSYKVNEGDNISINDSLDFNIDVLPEKIDLDIVYEDEYLMVINKKSGMVVHPAPGNYTGTLVNALLGRHELSSNGIRPGIVHRLDKDTSGLMLVAKTDKVHELLSEMIKNREVKRTYIALVEGTFNHETGTIDAPIGRDKNNREKMAVTSTNSKEAITDFEVVCRYSNCTLVECHLRTGRTHQIRVHMSYIKHPIINDPLYGKKINNNDFGQLLHSKKIEFIHPITKKHLVFESKPPKEFYDLVSEYVGE